MRSSICLVLALEVISSLALPTAPKQAIQARQFDPAVDVLSRRHLAANHPVRIRQEEEEAQRVDVIGKFGNTNTVVGGLVRQNIHLPVDSAGALEVEYIGATENTIIVAPKMASIAAPAGMVYVDPLTFTISVATAPTAGDTLKVDYIYTAATRAIVDVTKAVAGKLDTATNQFVTTGLGTFKVEVDEDEWSQTVTDLNGEWAFFVPTTALLPAKAEE